MAGERARSPGARRGGGSAGRREVAGPKLAVRLAHAAGVTSPRRAAILVIVLCALVLSVAVPARNYLSQRSELAAVRSEHDRLADEVAELERRRVLLGDPTHIEAQARERLRYVRPGETPYIVQLPPGAGAGAQRGDRAEPWYTQLWDSITGAQGER